jgi:hypothetical protein
MCIMERQSRSVDGISRAALTRRQLFWLAACSAAGMQAASAATSTDRPLVGAIRWDAWYAPGSEVTSAVERTLSQPRYRWRQPFFAKQDDAGHVHLPSISQGLMDLEIEQAIYAGLDYWAFVAYPSDSSLSQPLQCYLASSRRRSLGFCMFTSLDSWGTTARAAALIEDHITLMENQAYTRVRVNRPLYYLGFITEQIANERWGGVDGLRTRIDQFRARAIARGVGNPYIVLGVLPRNATAFEARLGGDAAGAYTIADGRATGDYATLVRVTESGWQTLATSGLPVVPTVMAGWDRRPRAESPVPWERSQRPGVGIEHYFTAPDPAQLAAHLKQALAWVKRQPPDRQAPAVLIYAWNENDEGGWLVPTAPCDEGRLQAVHKVLAPQAKNSQPGCGWVD